MMSIHVSVVICKAISKTVVLSLWFIKLVIFAQHNRRVKQSSLRHSTAQQCRSYPLHCNGVIMSAMASQITSPTIVYSTVYTGADQRKHKISAALAFERGIHRWPVNSPRKWPVTRKMVPFDDVIMIYWQESIPLIGGVMMRGDGQRISGRPWREWHWME